MRRFERGLCPKVSNRLLKTNSGAGKHGNRVRLSCFPSGDAVINLSHPLTGKVGDSSTLWSAVRRGSSSAARDLKCGLIGHTCSGSAIRVRDRRGVLSVARLLRAWADQDDASASLHARRRLRLQSYSLRTILYSILGQPEVTRPIR